jgi:hypothetical protein
MKKRIIDGYHIVGSYQSVAWVKTKEEADELCEKMNYRGGTFYKIEPSYTTVENFVELSTPTL